MLYRVHLAKKIHKGLHFITTIRFNIGTPKFQSLFQLILTILKHNLSYSYKRLSMGVIFNYASVIVGKDCK
jgi:hypothetical protein